MSCWWYIPVTVWPHYHNNKSVFSISVYDAIFFVLKLHIWKTGTLTKWKLLFLALAPREWHQTPEPWICCHCVPQPILFSLEMVTGENSRSVDGIHIYASGNPSLAFSLNAFPPVKCKCCSTMCIYSHNVTLCWRAQTVHESAELSLFFKRACHGSLVFP